MASGAKRALGIGIAAVVVLLVVLLAVRLGGWPARENLDALPREYSGVSLDMTEKELRKRFNVEESPMGAPYEDDLALKRLKLLDKNGFFRRTWVFMYDGKIHFVSRYIFLTAGLWDASLSEVIAAYFPLMLKLSKFDADVWPRAGRRASDRLRAWQDDRTYIECELSTLGETEYCSVDLHDIETTEMSQEALDEWKKANPDAMAAWEERLERVAETMAR